MFKVGMALVFSVIAALVVFLTGMIGDARVTTALLRSFIAFLCAGLFTYLVVFILEAKGWAAFDKEPSERMQDMQTQLYDPEDIDFDAVEKGARAAEEFAAQKNFRPLSEDSFVHMRTPEGEGTPEPAPA
jgi:hypothetical protein